MWWSLGVWLVVGVVGVLWFAVCVGLVVGDDWLLGVCDV